MGGMGPWVKGSPCGMLIFICDNVPVSVTYFPTCNRSNLRKCHVACHCPF